MTRDAQIHIEMFIEHDPESRPTDYLFQDPQYRHQDEARLAAWRHGDWHFVGVRAKATIKFPCGANPDCWTTSELFSPGLWGIESDSGHAYFEEVYQEERAALIDMLASLKTSELITPSTTTRQGGSP
jgi:hypothetical protein